MQALTAVAATLYAIGLWLLAPESVWQREVTVAKRNQQNRLTSTPEPIQQPQTEPIQITDTVPTIETEPTPETLTDTEPTPETDTTPETEALTDTEPDAQPETLTDTIATPEPQQPDYSSLPITKLRELAKQRKLNWRPLINGKRKPLNKPQLIELLTA